MRLRLRDREHGGELAQREVVAKGDADEEQACRQRLRPWPTAAAVVRAMPRITPARWMSSRPVTIVSRRAQRIAKRRQSGAVGTPIVASAGSRRTRGPNRQTPWARSAEDGLSVLRLPLDVTDPVQR